MAVSDAVHRVPLSARPGSLTASMDKWDNRFGWLEEHGRCRELLFGTFTEVVNLKQETSRFITCHPESSEQDSNVFVQNQQLEGARSWRSQARQNYHLSELSDKLESVSRSMPIITQSGEHVKDLIHKAANHLEILRQVVEKHPSHFHCHALYQRLSHEIQFLVQNIGIQFQDMYHSLRYCSESPYLRHSISITEDVLSVIRSHDSEEDVLLEVMLPCYKNHVADSDCSLSEIPSDLVITSGNSPSGTGISSSYIHISPHSSLEYNCCTINMDNKHNSSYSSMNRGPINQTGMAHAPSASVKIGKNYSECSSFKQRQMAPAEYVAVAHSCKTLRGRKDDSDTTNKQQPTQCVQTQSVLPATKEEETELFPESDENILVEERSEKNHKNGVKRHASGSPLMYLLHPPKQPRLQLSPTDSSTGSRSSCCSVGVGYYHCIPEAVGSQHESLELSDNTTLHQTAVPECTVSEADKMQTVTSIISAMLKPCLDWLRRLTVRERESSSQT